jgi:hypothetical protein
MDTHINLLSQIDFSYWKEKNPYFSETELNSSMRAAITLIKNRGLLKDFSPKKALDYSVRIENEVKNFNPSKPDYERLSLIFDLIQAWGGQTGRTPYVIRKGNSLSSRDRYTEWKLDYFNGVINALEDRPVNALREWKKINGIGASFAPKHLRFWTNKYPVLDTRISLLLCGSKKLLYDADKYDEFLLLLSPLVAHFHTDMLSMEKALFAFSQNFFLNDKLAFKKMEIVDKKNIEIAQELSSL